MTATVLLAAGEGRDSKHLRRSLERTALSVIVVSSGECLLEQVKALRPDLVVLALDLPDLHGLDVCRRLRCTSNVPVVAVGEASADIDRILALEMGADDVIVSPCDAAELCERVKAALRRAVPSQSDPERVGEVLRFGDMVIDRRLNRLSISDREHQLTPMESALMWALAVRAGEVIRSEELLHEVWGYPEGVRTRTLDVHISRLRRKLGEDGRHPQLIITVRGVGYRFDPPVTIGGADTRPEAA